MFCKRVQPWNVAIWGSLTARSESVVDGPMAFHGESHGRPGSIAPELWNCAQKS
jgi:hypothetical protein